METFSDKTLPQRPYQRAFLRPSKGWHYPAHRADTVQMTGHLEYAPSRGFTPFFRHIIRNDISMTSPVETWLTDKALVSKSMILDFSLPKVLA